MPLYYDHHAKANVGSRLQEVPWDSSHAGAPLLSANAALTNGSELPLPCHTHKRKCSWKTGFLLSGTVFVFCLHLQSASGTIDILTEQNKQR